MSVYGDRSFKDTYLRHEIEDWFEDMVLYFRRQMLEKYDNYEFEADRYRRVLSKIEEARDCFRQQYWTEDAWL